MTPIRRWIPERVRKWYRSLRLRLGMNTYGHAWDELALTNPWSAVLPTVSSEEEFDKAGKETAEWVHQILGNGLKVLDVGCGPGRVDVHLAPHCRELWCVDVSTRMLKLARRRLAKHSNVQVRLLGQSGLREFSDKSFDALFCLYVLEHVETEDAFRYLLQFNRVLKDDGLCIVQFPNICSEAYFDAFMVGVALEPGRRPILRPRFYTVEEVQFKLDKAGFKVTDLKLEGPEIFAICRKSRDVSMLKPEN